MFEVKKKSKKIFKVKKNFRKKFFSENSATKIPRKKSAFFPPAMEKKCGIPLKKESQLLAYITPNASVLLVSAK